MLRAGAGRLLPPGTDPLGLRPDRMKLKVCLGALVWALLITLAHIQLNVGWSQLATKTRVLLGMERPELIVGFLPVT